MDRGKSYGGLALGSFVNTIAYAAAGRHWWSLAAAVLCLAFLVGLAVDRAIARAVWNAKRKPSRRGREL